MLLLSKSCESNSLLIAEVGFETFFDGFYHFLEKWVFTYFKVIYFYKSRPNMFIEGDEKGIFSKNPDWKHLFLLKMRVGQIRPIIQSSSTLIGKPRPIPTVKNLYSLMSEKKTLHTGKDPRKARCRQISAFCFRYICKVWRFVQSQKNFTIFTLI